VWDDEDNMPPTEPTTGEVLSPEERMFLGDDDFDDEDNDLPFSFWAVEVLTCKHKYDPGCC
jgi:hypothetical protein